MLGVATGPLCRPHSAISLASSTVTGFCSCCCTKHSNCHLRAIRFLGLNWSVSVIFPQEAVNLGYLMDIEYLTGLFQAALIIKYGSLECHEFNSSECFNESFIGWFWTINFQTTYMLANELKLFLRWLCPFLWFL